MKKQINIGSYLYNTALKDIKKKVGASCTLLTNYIKADGSRYVKTIVQGSTYMFEIPYDITSLTKADYERLEELIKSKCL